MALEDKAKVDVNAPLCVFPEDNREVHKLSGLNLCTYELGTSCKYRKELMSLQTCRYGQKDSE